jgi:hypothetical protein
MRLYLTLGGVAAYHELVGDVSYQDAIDRYILNRNTMLVDDIPYDLSEELGGMADDSFKVLESITSGYNTYKMIAGRTGLNDNRLSDCLGRLVGIGVIGKMESVPEARKSNVYVVSDRLISFYFSIVQRYNHMLGGPDGVYQAMAPMLQTHLGKEFESFCRDVVLCNYHCEKVGSWWGAVPVRDDYGHTVKDGNGKVSTEDVDIDVTATIKEGQNRIDLFGECKFTSKKVGFGALNTLEERVGYLKGRYNARLALFSMSGFESELMDYAESNGILLFGSDVLVGLETMPDVQ